MARCGSSVGRQTPCYGPPVPPYVQSLGGLELRRYVMTLLKPVVGKDGDG